MKKFFVLGLLMLGQLMLNAQANKGIEFVDGWCLLKKGDTLRGKICIENTKTGERFEKIMFIDAKDAAGNKKRYGIEKISSFGTTDKVYDFVTLEEGIAPFVMERVITGDLSLYRCWFKLEDSTPQKINYEVGMFLKKKDAEEYFEVLDKKFQKEMAAFFKGDDDIIKLIKENNYTSKDLDKIVQAYNSKE